MMTIKGIILHSPENHFASAHGFYALYGNYFNTTPGPYDLIELVLFGHVIEIPGLSRLCNNYNEEKLSVFTEHGVGINVLLPGIIIIDTLEMWQWFSNQSFGIVTLLLAVKIISGESNKPLLEPVLT